MAQTPKSDGRRKKFGAAVQGLLRARGMSQTDFGEALGGTTQSAISAWIQGIAEPAPAVVFEAERILGTEPGSLSQHLGYLPVDASRVVSDFESVVMNSELLDDDRMRFGLLALYKELTVSPAKRKPTK